MSELELICDGPEHGVTIALAHGAGAAMDSDWMNDLTARLVAAGMRVARFEFPYMRRRRADGKRRGPDRPAVLVDTWHGVIERLGNEDLVIGGKSMGGRIASMVADDAGVAGLVCVGYPFHPPGRPEKLRTAHLERLRTPTLIVQGTRDPFGVPDEVAEYRLSQAIGVHWSPDGDHSLKPRVRSGRTLEQNLDEAAERIDRFVRSL